MMYFDCSSKHVSIYIVCKTIIIIIFIFIFGIVLQNFDVPKYYCLSVYFKCVIMIGLLYTAEYNVFE